MPRRNRFRGILEAAAVLELVPSAFPPSDRNIDDVYLDDGTNTASGKPGWMYLESTGPDVWTDVLAEATNASPFEADTGNNEIQPVTADIGRSFIVGSQTMDDSGPANDARMFFDKSSGAFRAGRVYGAEWDSANRGTGSFASGEGTTAYGSQSHAEGYNSTASGEQAHSEGNDTTASGDQSHTEGKETIASGLQAHAEGYKTDSINEQTHAEGYDTTASGLQAHAEGNITVASGPYSHAEGYNTTASGKGSHAEGDGTSATGTYSHAEGHDTVAAGSGGSHAEGDGTSVSSSGTSGHAEGKGSVASGQYSHAQNRNTQSSGNSSFSWGNESIARIWGGEAFSADSFSNYGDGQSIRFTVGGRTTDDLPTELSAGFASAGIVPEIPDNGMWGFTIRVMGRSGPGDGGEAFLAIIEGLAKRNGLNVELIPGPSPLNPRLAVSSTGAAAWFAYVQNSIDRDFDVMVVGDPSDTVHWVAEIQATEIIMLT